MPDVMLKKGTFCVGTDENSSLIKLKFPANYTAVTSAEIFYERYLMSDIDDISNGIGPLNSTLNFYLAIVYAGIFYFFAKDILQGKFSLGSTIQDRRNV